MDRDLILKQMRKHSPTSRIDSLIKALDTYLDVSIDKIVDGIQYNLKAFVNKNQLSVYRTEISKAMNNCHTTVVERDADGKPVIDEQGNKVLKQIRWGEWLNDQYPLVDKIARHGYGKGQYNKKTTWAQMRCDMGTIMNIAKEIYNSQRIKEKYIDPHLATPHNVDTVPADINSLEAYIAMTESHLEHPDSTKGQEYYRKMYANWIIAQNFRTYINHFGSACPQVYHDPKLPGDRTYYKGLSLQTAPKMVRHAVLGQCVEIDISNMAFSYMIEAYHKHLLDVELTKHAYYESKELFEEMQDNEETLDVDIASIQRQLNNIYIKAVDRAERKINKLELKDYVENKSAWRKRLAKLIKNNMITPEGDQVYIDTEFAEKLVKQVFQIIAFGGKTSNGYYNNKGEWVNNSIANVIYNSNARAAFLADPMVEQLLKDINKISKKLGRLKAKADPALAALPEFNNGNGNKYSSITSYLYRVEEGRIMNTVKKYCADKGIEVLLQVHDALYVRTLSKSQFDDITTEVKAKHGNSYRFSREIISANYKVVDWTEVTADIESHQARIAEEERQARNYTASILIETSDTDCDPALTMRKINIGRQIANAGMEPEDFEDDPEAVEAYQLYKSTTNPIAQAMRSQPVSYDSEEN